jgi:hypothetical protein
VRLLPKILIHGRFRFTAILLLIYQAFFFNVVIPGHTRGIITLGGESKVAGPQALGYVCGCPPVQKSDHEKCPTPKDRSQCAICYIAARLTTSAVIDVHLDKLCLLEQLPPPAPESAVSSGFVFTYYACGPPPAMV